MMTKPTTMFDIIRMLLLPVAFLLCLYVGKLSFTNLMNDKSALLEKYIAMRGDLNTINHSFLLVQVADNVKAMIPPDACVEVSRVPLALLLAFRYYVYPIKFVVSEVNDFNGQPRVCNGHYFIDLNSQIKNPPPNWHAVPLRGGFHIYAIGDSHVNQNPKLTPTALPWSGWAFCLFAIMGFLIGCFILCGFIKNVADWPLSGKLGGAFLLGFIGVTFPFWILALFRVPLNDFLVCVGLPVLVLLYYFFMKQRGGSLRSAFKIKKFTVSSALCNVVGLAAIIFYFLLIVSFPVGIVDEVHIWLLKAKMFFDLRVLNFDYTEIITNYYPVFWPLYLTLQFIFTRGDHDQIAKCTAAFIFISSLGLMKSISISLGLGKKTSWLVVLVFLLYFHHWTFFTALAENIYIALVLLNVAFFIDWMKNRSTGSLYATVISLVGLCGAKFEGTVAVGFFFIAYIISQKPRLHEIWPNIKSILPLSIAFLMQPLWLCWLDFQGAHYSVFHLRRAATPENLLAILQMTVMYLSNSPITLMIIILAGLIPFLYRNTRPWSPPERFLLVLICGLVLFAYSAGLCWTNSDFWGYYSEVWLRLVSRAMPFAVLLWMSRTLVLKNKS